MSGAVEGGTARRAKLLAQGAAPANLSDYEQGQARTGKAPG